MPDFLPYQKRFLEDKAQNVVWEKSRRIGASWVMAAEAIIHAALGNGNVYYCAYEKDMTRQFIADCRTFAREYQDLVHPAIIQDDPDKDNLVFEIKTTSGKSVRSLTSKARNFRSKGAPGDIFVIDEAAFIDDLPEFLKAAAAVAMWGGKLRIISTHNGEDSPFNELVQDIRAGKKPGWSLHRTTLDDALNDGLYKRICEVSDKQWTAAAEQQWRARIISDAGPNAEEEYQVIPSSGSGAWLTGALIEARQSSSCQVLRWQSPARDFAQWSDGARTREATRFWEEKILPRLRQTKGRGCIGYDFARNSDLSVICPARLTSAMRRLADFIELRDIPFQQQEQILSKIINYFYQTDGFGGAAIDARGNGQYIAERAQQEFGATAVEAVMLTERWYRENMPPVKAAFEDDTLTIPLDEGAYNDLRSVKMLRGVPRIPDTRTTDASGKRHGDAAIALALAYAATRASTGPLEYEPINPTDYKSEYDQWIS